MITDYQLESKAEIACRNCGVCDEIKTLPGKPPHYKELRCKACGAFVKWLAKPREDRDAWPPTLRQLRYIAILGYRGESPQTRRQASELIDELKKGAA